MLQGLCTYAIVGHSERRAYFAESDEFVNAKVHIALAHDLTPILCVGETLEQREAGQTAAILSTQTSGGLADVEDVSTVVIAYEPVWAIGTGVAATPDDARDGIAVIRQTIADARGADVSGVGPYPLRRFNEPAECGVATRAAWHRRRADRRGVPERGAVCGAGAGG